MIAFDPARALDNNLCFLNNLPYVFLIKSYLWHNKPPMHICVSLFHMICSTNEFPHLTLFQSLPALDNVIFACGG